MTLLTKTALVLAAAALAAASNTDTVVPLSNAPTIESHATASHDPRPANLPDFSMLPQSATWGDVFSANWR